jgi:hypothetical protein
MAKPRKIQVTIAIDEDIKQWAEGQAEQVHASFAWALRLLLRTGFEELQRREGDSNPRLQTAAG